MEVAKREGEENSIQRKQSTEKNVSSRSYWHEEAEGTFLGETIMLSWMVNREARTKFRPGCEGRLQWAKRWVYTLQLTHT